MKRTSRFALLLLTIMMLAVVDAQGVSACSCVVESSLIHAVADATAVFSGTVTDVERSPASRGVRATVDVTQIWKGPTDRTLTVGTGSGGGDCGYEFKIGTAYLIFAYGRDGQLYTSICNRTQPVETAPRDITTLNSIFPPSPPVKFQLPATVTVTGHGSYSPAADQIAIRLLFREGRQGESPGEEDRQRLADVLVAHGATQEMLFSMPFSSDRAGFYFTVNEEDFPNASPSAFLQLLSEAEATLQQDSTLAIDRIEVMFALQDCTRAVVGARRSALEDAWMRAELVAALAGGKPGAVVAVTEVPTNASPQANAGLCDVAQTGEWHEIPLQSDLRAVQSVDRHAALTVTFTVEERQSVQ